MEVIIESSLLADPKDCRAFVAHHHKDNNWDELAQYAHEIIPMFNGKSIFPDTAANAERTHPARAINVISRYQFDSSRDYLVLAGDLLIQSVCVAEIARRVGGFTALRFDKRNGKYWPFRIG